MRVAARSAQIFQTALVKVKHSLCPCFSSAILTPPCRVLLDDTDLYARVGGGGYERYGIDAQQGAIVVVRPDGYVGAIAPFDRLADLDAYFASFMVA